MNNTRGIWQALNKFPGQVESSRPRGIILGDRIGRNESIQDVIDAFWSRVDIRGDNECWEWSGARHHTNYGHYGILYRSFLSHRVSFALWNGRDPRGWMLHRCDNPPCCNPNHLYEGTPADNNRDTMMRGRVNRCRGDAHPDCKIPDAAILEIASMDLRKGMYGPLIEKYGVSYKTLWAISRGKYRRKPCVKPEGGK